MKCDHAVATLYVLHLWVYCSHCNHWAHFFCTSLGVPGAEFHVHVQLVPSTVLVCSATSLQGNPSLVITERPEKEPLTHHPDSAPVCTFEKMAPRARPKFHPSVPRSRTIHRATFGGALDPKMATETLMGFSPSCGFLMCQCHKLD